MDYRNPTTVPAAAAAVSRDDGAGAEIVSSEDDPTGQHAMLRMYGQPDSPRGRFHRGRL